jgi:AbrB family looped-hinge helix DNA binding protein
MEQVEIEMSSKGQIVIPAEMRKRFGLTRGDKFVAWSKDDLILLKPVIKLSSLRGKYKLRGGTRELAKLRSEDLRLEKERTGERR